MPPVPVGTTGVPSPAASLTGRVFSQQTAFLLSPRGQAGVAVDKAHGSVGRQRGELGRETAIDKPLRQLGRCWLDKRLHTMLLCVQSQQPHHTRPGTRTPEEPTVPPMRSPQGLRQNTTHARTANSQHRGRIQTKCVNSQKERFPPNFLTLALNHQQKPDLFLKL